MSSECSIHSHDIVKSIKFGTLKEFDKKENKKYSRGVSEVARSDLKDIQTTVYTYEFNGYNTMNHEIELSDKIINIFANKEKEKYRGRLEIVPNNFPLSDKWFIQSKKVFDRELRALVDIESIFTELESILHDKDYSNFPNHEAYELGVLD